MKLSLLVISTLLSFNIFASIKKPVYGSEAFEIVKVLKELNVGGLPQGSSDTGHVGIVIYKFLGMECETAFSNYGGYGSKPEAGCHFDKVKSKEDLKKLRSVLRAAGLSTKNKIFKD